MNINLEWTEFWYSGNTKALSEYRRLSNEKSAQLPPKKKVRRRQRKRKRTARRKHRLRIF
ncbi:hypothetical protein C6499_22905 [Candidatus Poribacteria bacterium]|nr:MAG: hypothetical protein C6499_22905 [Candidatus Poribacteria bacterium]